MQRRKPLSPVVGRSPGRKLCDVGKWLTRWVKTLKIGGTTGTVVCPHCRDDERDEVNPLIVDISGIFFEDV